MLSSFTEGQKYIFTTLSLKISYIEIPRFRRVPSVYPRSTWLTWFSEILLSYVAGVYSFMIIQDYSAESPCSKYLRSTLQFSQTSRSFSEHNASKGPRHREKSESFFCLPASLLGLSLSVSPPGHSFATEMHLERWNFSSSFLYSLLFQIRGVLKVSFFSIWEWTCHRDGNIRGETELASHTSIQSPLKSFSQVLRMAGWGFPRQYFILAAEHFSQPGETFYLGSLQKRFICSYVGGVL